MSTQSGGYSSTPLAQKIGIKPGHTIHLLHRPAGWTIPDLPEGRTIAGGSPSRADTTIAFYRSLSPLRSDASGIAAELGDRVIVDRLATASGRPPKRHHREPGA